MSTSHENPAADDPLEILREEYKAKFAAVQTEEAHEAYGAAFASSSEKMGEVAVSAAHTS